MRILRVVVTGQGGGRSSNCYGPNSFRIAPISSCRGFSAFSELDAVAAVVTRRSERLPRVSAPTS